MPGPMSPSLVETMEALEDPRVDRTKLHPLTDILVLSVLAVICGADSFVAIALFGRLNEEWLRTFLKLPHGIPSHDTLGRVCARLDAAGFEEGFRDWVQAAFELTEGQVVPVDGKCVRGSHDRVQGLAPLHPVSAWAQANRLVLAQTAVDDKSNASTAIPELLRMLCLQGCIVTLDAMGCQKAIARQIREQGADYVLRGRANHKGLHRRLEDTFALERATGVSKSAAAGRPATPPCWPMSTPTVNGATWPVWSGASANAAAATGSRPTSASSFPVCPPEPGPCCRRCGNTGASRMHTTRSWTWPLARTTAASARAMPPTTWPSQAYRPQPAASGPVAQGGHRQQAAGGRLEQGLPVPTDWSQSQTNLYQSSTMS